MALDLVTIGFKVITGDLKKGREELGRLGTATDKASRSTTTFGRSTENLGTKIKGLIAPMNALKVALGGLGAGMIAGSFLAAAREVENYRVRLETVTRSQQRANQTFADVANFAKSVPFQFNEIAGSATNLTAILRGNTELVKEMLPVIADVAAGAGLGFRETAEQFQRTMTAGIASADMFRDRGVTAALAVPEAIKKSGPATLKYIMQMFQSGQHAWSGAADKLAGTWDGLMSMMKDKWFLLREAFMNGGVFEVLKGNLADLNKSLNENWFQILEKAADAGKKLGQAILDGMALAKQGFDLVKDSLGEFDKWLSEVTGKEDGLKELMKAFGLGIAAAAAVAALTFALGGLATVLITILNPVTLVIAALAYFKDDIAEMLTGTDNASAALQGFARAVEETGAIGTTIESIKQVGIAIWEVGKYAVENTVIMAKWAGNLVKEAWDVVVAFAGLFKPIWENAKPYLEALGNAASWVWEKYKVYLGFMKDALMSVVDVVKTVFATIGKALYRFLSDDMKAAIDNLKKEMDEAKAAAQEEIEFTAPDDMIAGVEGGIAGVQGLIATWAEVGRLTKEYAADIDASSESVKWNQEQVDMLAEGMKRYAEAKREADEGPGNTEGPRDEKHEAALARFQIEIERIKQLTEAAKEGKEAYEDMAAAFALMDKGYNGTLEQATKLTAERRKVEKHQKDMLEIANLRYDIREASIDQHDKLVDKLERELEIAERIADIENFNAGEELEKNLTDGALDFWDQFREKGFSAFEDLGGYFKNTFAQFGRDIMASAGRDFVSTIMESDFGKQISSGFQGLIDGLKGKEFLPSDYSGELTDDQAITGTGLTGILQKLGSFGAQASPYVAAAITAFKLGKAAWSLLGFGDQDYPYARVSMGTGAGGAEITDVHQLDSFGQVNAEQLARDVTGAVDDMLLQLGADFTSSIAQFYTFGFSSGRPSGQFDKGFYGGPGHITFTQGTPSFEGIGKKEEDKFQALVLADIMKTAINQGIVEGIGPAVSQIFQYQYESTDQLNKAISAAQAVDEFIMTGEELSEWGNKIKDLQSKIRELRQATAEFGMTVAQVADLEAQAMAALREQFEQDIQDQILEFTSPLAAQFKELAETQAQRLQDAIDLGADLVEVEKLHALERAQIIEDMISEVTGSYVGLIEQTSDVVASFEALNRAFYELTLTLDQAGEDISDILNQWDLAREGFIDSFDAGIADKLAELSNPVRHAFNQLLKEQETRLNDAIQIGANVTAVERLNALERYRFIEQLSAEELEMLGELSDMATDVFSQITIILTQLNLVFDDQIEALEETRDAARENADAFRALSDALDASITSILSKYSTLPPGEQLNDLRYLFQTTANDALAGDLEAGNLLPQLADQLLELSRQFYASSTPFQNDLTMVLQTLENVRDFADQQAADAETEIDRLNYQISVVETIRDLLQQERPEVALLEEQIALVNIQNDMISGLLGQLSALYQIRYDTTDPFLQDVDIYTPTINPPVDSPYYPYVPIDHSNDPVEDTGGTDTGGGTGGDSGGSTGGGTDTGGTDTGGNNNGGTLEDLIGAIDDLNNTMTTGFQDLQGAIDDTTDAVESGNLQRQLDPNL